MLLEQTGRSFRRRWPLGCTLLLLLVALVACTDIKPVLKIRGATMGTTWNVTLSQGADDLGRIKAGVQGTLDRVDRRMSTWRNDSELSTLNNTALGQWLPVSAELVAVLSAARQISEVSQGAFDITVGPLVALWGFGASATDRSALPAAAGIAAARSQVNFAMVELRADPPAARRRGPVNIDLSAIAKGYAVDAVAEWLEGQGITDYLVEVGGEVRVGGVSPRKQPWRLGIERPDAMPGRVAVRVELDAGAVATSGDYRNFRVDGGVRRAHTIDPRTGYPVTHRTASVTVVRDNAMMADGWATALHVLGAEAGLVLADAHNVAVLFIVRGDDGLVQTSSSAMRVLLDGSATVR